MARRRARGRNGGNFSVFLLNQLDLHMHIKFLQPDQVCLHCTSLVRTVQSSSLTQRIKHTKTKITRDNYGMSISRL